MTNQIIPFIEFSKADYELQNPEQDILGFAVYDKDGEHVGYIEELLLDNSEPVRRDNPATRRVALAVVNRGGVLGNEQVMVPFELFRDPDQTRREVKVTYPKEYFDHEDIAFMGVNFLDLDATGRLYGFYNMESDWFTERGGADPEMVKHG